MKVKYLIGIAVFFILLVTWPPMTFAQYAGGCTVTSKDNNVIIYSCPDGTRTVDAGTRADLYRVGDRVDIYGMPGNQPTSRPGETTFPGR